MLKMMIYLKIILAKRFSFVYQNKGIHLHLSKARKDVENKNGKYISDYIPKKHRLSQIRGRLGEFLSNIDIQDRIIKLREL